MTIKSFTSKKLEIFFQSGAKTGIQPHHSAKLERILDRLDSATDIKDMDYPGSKLHSLKGKLKNFWSVEVNGNYRIWFRFDNENAYDGDYH